MKLLKSMLHISIMVVGQFTWTIMTSITTFHLHITTDGLPEYMNRNLMSYTNSHIHFL